MSYDTIVSHTASCDRCAAQVVGRYSTENLVRELVRDLVARGMLFQVGSELVCGLCRPVPMVEGSNMKTIHVSITFANADFDRVQPLDIWAALCRAYPLCRGDEIDVQPSQVQSLSELDQKLRARGLSLSVHPTAGGTTVWLFSLENPLVMHVTFHDLVERAIDLALKEWDDEHDEFFDDDERDLGSRSREEAAGKAAAESEINHSLRGGRS